MNYPTTDEVINADHTQLALWFRFLPYPGLNHVGRENFSTMWRHENDLLDLITDRLEQAGGITIAVSKQIGCLQPAI
jgi:hypothetical protein